MIEALKLDKAQLAMERSAPPRVQPRHGLWLGSAPPFELRPRRPAHPPPKQGCRGALGCAAACHTASLSWGAQVAADEKRALAEKTSQLADEIEAASRMRLNEEAKLKATLAAWGATPQPPLEHLTP